MQSLPRKITSSHSLCNVGQRTEKNLEGSLNEENKKEENSPKEMFLEGMKLFLAQDYDGAFNCFNLCQEKYLPAKYQIAVMYYDGLGRQENHEHAVSLMKEVIEDSMPHYPQLIPCAQYNIGRAYYEGYGVKQSDEHALQWWLKSARDGEPDACIKAQSVLGMFYSRTGEETTDMQKSHFWHQEATGNGSLESQGTLGVMYEHGIGVEKNLETSFKCFKSAAQRGNVYAMGNLAFHYYKSKMLRNAFDVAKRLVAMEDTAQLSRETDCLETYIKKGIALGHFIYGRCLARGVIENTDPKESLQWYSKCAIIDPDTAQYMQDMLQHGKI